MPDQSVREVIGPGGWPHGRPDSLGVGLGRPQEPVCCFDDWLAGQRLSLTGLLSRIAVSAPGELADAWAAIAQARAAGHWVALLLDYELGEWLEPAVAGPERASDVASDDATRPRLTALVFEQGSWSALPETPAEDLAPGADEAAMAGRMPGFRPGVSRQRHARDVETIRARIARGDFYQVNYTLPLWLDWPAAADPKGVYERLARQHPVRHAACVQDGNRWLLSLSPELFVARQGQRLRMRPMKGTAPRHPDPARDHELGQALRVSAKNRAENLMIVDLLRNDLGRIALPGSVRVPALFSLEAYPSVWTLTSTVEATVPDVPLSRVLRALFPCGSVTGAPKIAAMQAIRALERRRRGIYCGSIGWLAPDGDFSLNVAIRTIELRGGQAQFGVGGGIVHDSEGREEWHECLWKARVLGAGA